MRISFKKTLALVLSVILVLSTFVGVLSISTYAADSFGTMTVAEQSPVVDENGNFTVKYDVSINNASKIIELLFKPTGLPEGTTYVGEDNVGTVSGMDADDQATVKLVNENIWVEIVAGETNVQTFTVELNVNKANPATFTLGAADGTVKLGEDSEAAEYTLTVTPGTIKFACKHVETSADNAVPATCTQEGKEADTICSACGITLKEGAEIPALGHTEGTPVDNDDGTHTISCTVCSEVIRTEDHAFVEGTCACGAKEVTGPVLDETVVFYDAMVTVTNTVNIQYRVMNSVFSKYGAGATIKIIATGKEYSFETATLYNEVDIPETEVRCVSSGTKGSTYLYEGIAMCSLGLNISAYIQVYDAEGNYVAHSKPIVSSPETLLKTTLSQTVTENGKKSITELLNMAAAAQVQFAANKAGTHLAQAVADGKLVNKDVDQTYTIKTEDLPEFNTTAVVTPKDGVDFVSIHSLSAQISLIQSPVPCFYIGTAVNNSDSTKNLDASKVKMVFSYYDADPTVKKTVTKTVDGAVSPSDILIAGKRFAINVPSFEFHNANETITAVCYYDGAEVGTVEYSMGKYISTKVSSGSDTEKALNLAIAKFSYAFRLNKGITE